jgi:hypothetical protein
MKYLAFLLALVTAGAQVVPPVGTNPPGVWRLISQAIPVVVPPQGYVVSTTYAYAAQTPGGTLTGGFPATAILTPCPAGVSGTDTLIHFYISGGTGTAEGVTSTGGGTSGTTCTVKFTPANNHTGAWTIQSASQGIYEAVAANPGKQIYMPAGVYTMRDCMSFNPDLPLSLTGANSGSTGTTTFLSFGGVTNICNAITISDTAINSTEPKLLSHFQMQGTGTSTGGSGIKLNNVVRVTLDGVQVNSFALDGVVMTNAFETLITGGCQFIYNGHWGVDMVGTLNLNRIEHSYFGQNSRSSGFGNISIIGTSSTSGAESVVLDGVDVEGAGTLPFTSVATAYGLFVQNVLAFTLANSYLEGNLTDAVLYQGGVSGLTEYNNWINTSGIIYASGTVSVKSWNNTFVSGATRTVTGVDLSTWEIGPDSCVGGTTECTQHPRTLAMYGSTGAGSALLGTNSPASTLTAPYTWLKMLAPDGSVVYLPAWK